MSWTSLLMLRWHEGLEPDERLSAYAARYGDALLRLQDKRGFFPAWLDRETLKPLGVLDNSPETSLSVTFLLALARSTGRSDYRDAAVKAMDAVATEIVPEGRWEDFETYWSCSSWGIDDLLGKKVERNDLYKQNTFSMFWTAEALLETYRATGKREYLALGERVLDELLMAQASWQPPYMYVDVLGGFGVMNADGEWNDSRESLFAETIVRYGQELSREEYVERGLAALRSSFVMMYAPENPRTKEQWEKRHPFFGPEDYGFTMENYGHGGRTSPEGEGMGVFTIYDWGNGAAAEAYNRMVDHFGPELVHRH
jgi:rhamnogalacturonyl hydrolase YesR